MVPLLRGFLDAFDAGLDEFLRNHAAHDLVEDLDALALDVRLKLDFDVAVLAAATGLADELAHAFGLARDRFAVRDLRAAGVGLDLEFAEEAVADDFQVQLAHAGDDGLAGLGVAGELEGRVFLGQALQADGEFFLVNLRLRLDGHRDDRLGEGRRLEAQFEILVAQRVAGDDILGADDGANVTGINGVHVHALVGLQETAGGRCAPSGACAGCRGVSPFFSVPA